MRDPKERLRDILEAIVAIERYRDRGRAAFEQDELLQVWFLRHLQIIGEAARALPEELWRVVEYESDTELRDSEQIPFLECPACLSRKRDRQARTSAGSMARRR